MTANRRVFRDNAGGEVEVRRAARDRIRPARILDAKEERRRHDLATPERKGVEVVGPFERTQGFIEDVKGAFIAR